MDMIAGLKVMGEDQLGEKPVGAVCVWHSLPDEGLDKGEVVIDIYVKPIDAAAMGSKDDQPNIAVFLNQGQARALADLLLYRASILEREAQMDCATICANLRKADD